jgi:signal transduction histidine kinase/DNA-binding NarL/FixJ family response regulator
VWQLRRVLLRWFEAQPRYLLLFAPPFALHSQNVSIPNFYNLFPTITIGRQALGEFWQLGCVFQIVRQIGKPIQVGAANVDKMIEGSGGVTVASAFQSPTWGKVWYNRDILKDTMGGFMFHGIILAVSDERETRDLLAQVLSARDGPALVVEGAEQAIAALNEHGVAVVILDWPLSGTQDDVRAGGEALVRRARQAWPGVPIIGLLAPDGNVASTDLAALDADDYLIKPPVPDLVCRAVDRALELRRLRREAERLALINHVCRQITSILDMTQLLWEVARLIRESFDFYYVGIALLEGNRAEVKAAVGGERDQLPPIGVRYKLQEEQEMIAWTLARQEPLLIADTRDAPQYVLPPALSQARSALVVPIVLQAKQLGVLEVLSAEPHAFEPGDLPLFESLTAQIAVAVQNARLFNAQQKQEEMLHSLNVAAVAMQRVISSRTEVLEVMASELGRSGFASLVHLLDPVLASAYLAYSSLSSRLTNALTELLEIPLDNWPLDTARAPTYRRVLDERRAIFFDSVESLVGEIVPAALPADKVTLITQILGNPRAVIAPMCSGDRMVGWVTVFSSQLTIENHPAIMAFANQATVALENARLLASARRADKLALLIEAGQAMSATLEFDGVLQLLLQAVTEAVQVDEGIVALWDEATQRYVPRARLLDGQVSLVDPSNGDAVISESSLPSLHVPLAGHNRVLGLLALGRHSDGNELSTEDVQVAQALTNQAASALENARLYTELKRSAEELEHSQRRLTQSEKLAATGQLAASIAHEINNPLQAIKNCLELILDEAGAGEPLDRTYLDVAMNELERIRGIIRQMLDLYRPSQRRMVPVDLNAAVEGVLALMRKQLASQDIIVETHLDDTRPHIAGRGDQIRQVFINLILNAIEAMPEGGQLTLTTHQDHDGFVTVQVIDIGVGIAPENLTRIADPFFTTKSKGVGLGLTICHEIIERHQGALDVISRVGYGSTFTIRLPAAE